MMGRKLSRAEFAKRIATELERMFGERRVQVVVGVLGLFGVTATPIFSIEPWWIGPAVVAGLTLTLLAEAGFRTWRTERRRLLELEVNRDSEYRKLAVEGLFAVLLMTGRVLIEAPRPAPGAASRWERQVGTLIEAAYGLKHQALFQQDGGMMADAGPNFDLINTREILGLRYERLTQLMSNPPPLRNDFNPDEEEWAEFRGSTPRLPSKGCNTRLRGDRGQENSKDERGEDSQL
jgi:hypothetical protein